MHWIHFYKNGTTDSMNINSNGLFGFFELRDIMIQSKINDNYVPDDDVKLGKTKVWITPISSKVSK